MIEKALKGSGDLIGALLRNLSGRTEENHKT
jgi:hypothetical protein